MLSAKDHPFFLSLNVLKVRARLNKGINASSLRPETLNKNGLYNFQLLTLDLTEAYD